MSEEPRLASLDREQPQLLARVRQRVLDRLTSAARAGSDASLEYILNETVVLELKRLESGPASKEERTRIEHWRQLGRELGRMDRAAVRAVLEQLVDEYAADVAGRFSPSIYRFSSSVLPGLLGVILVPGASLPGIAAPPGTSAVVPRRRLSWRDGPAELARRFRIEGPIDRIAACARRGTLVLTPTHSSNLDSAVLGYSLHLTGLPPVTYGAGKNLFTNKLIGFFLRNMGAYRVDRRLKHSLYKEVLKAYSTTILAHGYHSLFFPGGTRSRSGLVEPHLKLGLLSTALDAYADHLREGRDRRIYIVPITLNYSITLEAETLIEDHLAEEGRQRYIIEDDESAHVRPALAFLRRILALDGAIVIRYGAPLDPFGNTVDDAGESLSPAGHPIDPAGYLRGPDGTIALDAQRDAEYTRGLADELVAAYRRETVPMPTNVVARVVFDRVAARLGVQDIYRLLRIRAPTGTLVSTVLADLAAWIAHLGLRTTPEACLEEALRAFGAFHSRPAALRAGDRIEVGHLRLLYYYRNRMNHLASPPGLETSHA